MINLLSKILILALFIFSGISKIFNFKSTYKSVKDKNIPYPILATFLAIIFELLGSFFVFFSSLSSNVLFFLGPSYGVIGSIMLIIFTGLATFFYHNIFKDFNEKYNFLKNVAIIGGLLLLMKDYF